MLKTLEHKRRHLSSNGKKTGSGEDEEKKKTEIDLAPPVGVLEIFKFAGIVLIKQQYVQHSVVPLANYRGIGP